MPNASRGRTVRTIRKVPASFQHTGGILNNQRPHEYRKSGIERQKTLLYAACIY